MQICLASFDDHEIMLELRAGLVYIDGEVQPIKHVTEEEIRDFATKLEAVPQGSDPGLSALLDAKRAEILVSLLGRAVGEECIDFLTTLLDRLHFNVRHYLDEDHSCECHHHEHA
ncbi:MAG: hypothetical protein J5846_10110 [Desulfovibrio sp.]|nr:hypothetical protein [Desulfovibrio sp.]